jgi:hypothetical protein
MILSTICDVDLDAAGGVGGPRHDGVDGTDRVGVPDPTAAVPGSMV